MSAADWYPDPTRPGRLRYWDGVVWTQHVSEDGEVAADAIEGIPPAPPLPGTEARAATQAAAAAQAPVPGAVEGELAPHATPGVAGAFGASGTPGGPTLVGRIGFGIAAVGGLLASLTSGSVVAEQEEPFGASITVGGGAWIGILAAVVCVAGALSPWLWGRISAAVLAWMSGALIAFAVIGFRTDDLFAVGSSASDVTLGRAGVMMVLGSVLLFVGTAIALKGIRVPVRDSDPAAVANPREGKAVASLVCGIVGILILVPAPAAVAMGLAARDDDVASAGKSGGRGLAVAGVVLGIVAMVLWGVGLTLGGLLAQPS